MEGEGDMWWGRVICKRMRVMCGRVRVICGRVRVIYGGGG